jgi:hypothetical protein
MSKGENMVERCARAVHAIQFEDKEQAEYEWHHFSGAQEYSQKLARAVIEALMEPTPAVVQTGAAEIRKFDRERDSSDEGAVSVFRAMLRTALSQPNEGK